MTTDKKSSFSERFKSLRDKVASAITAAEEEETSVAGLVSPDSSAEASPAQEKREDGPARRASNDDIASALMKFTWANGKPEIQEQPEEIRAFFEEIPADPVSDTHPEAENLEDDPYFGFAESEADTEAPSDISVEEDAEPWEKVLAEAEALLAQEPAESISVNWGSPSEGSFSTPPLEQLGEEAETELKDGAETERTPEHTPDAETHEETAFQNKSAAGSGFSWSGLLSGLQEEEQPDMPESIRTEPERAVSELPQEADPRQDAEPESAGSGLAALFAALRRDGEKKREAEEKPEETPDISMFLQEINENTNEADADGYEPDPQDVARLWEPRTEHRTGENDREDPSLDPNREATHVFTEEDLKNLPKEEDPSGDDASSLSDYRDTDDEEEGYSPRDFRPIRRRRYYRTGIVGGIMYFLFVLCVSVALACFAWLAADDMLSLNKEYVEAEVYVGEDMDVEQVATELQTKGLIRYRKLFTLFGKFFHAEEKIEPGTYTLSTKLDYRALIQNMHHYTGWTGEELATVKVTIPEGKTVMETFQILAEHGVCPYETLMECAATETFDYDFLADIPKGDATRLEGFLFPDTYEFYADSSPKGAICRFLDNFGTRIGDRVTEQAAAQGYTLREIITIASLIEKEAGGDLERARIASVIYNRLQSTSYPYLQIDATIQYAMGEHKEHLTNQDLQVDSPYNTYLYPGLPPGPIANPGLASIRAALAPESTGYYFYALNKNGMHEFFTSYNAFQRFINSSDFGG